MKFIRTLFSAALLSGATLAHADLAYTFDTDAQGFTVEPSAGLLSHLPGGYLRVVDSTGDTNVALRLPSAALAGGWAGYAGGTISFDARMESPINAYWPEFGTVFLFSSQGNLALDVALGDEPGANWKTYSARFDPADWGTTPAQLSAVLANVDRVEISLEAGNGPVEIVHIDNLKVTAVPEPVAGLLAGAGLLTSGLLARRRRAWAPRA